MKATVKEAADLLLDGAIALAQMEANGIRIDTEYLDATIEKVGKRIKHIEEKMRNSEVYTKWRRAYGQKTNLGSRQQLAEVLFNLMGYSSTGETKSKRQKTDKTALETIDNPFVKSFLKVEGLKKLKSTYLIGIRNEVVDGFLHPFFNLHTVKTWRSSSSSPNFQNIPIRDPEIGQYIRRAFIPREGCYLVENDFGALEFRIAASVWNDPKMIEYASDPTKDIHRDMAASLFCVKTSEVSKEMRQSAKSLFVFATLYGSFYVLSTQRLWNDLQNLKNKKGTPVLEILRNKGITQQGLCDHREKPVQGTYEFQVKKVEDGFFELFSVMKEKRDRLFKKYQETGTFYFVTGFQSTGIYSRNDFLNHRIQGPGAHCLLWTIIQLQKRINREKMKSMLVGQVHDCVNSDVPYDEIQTYLNMVKIIVEVLLPKQWEWIKTPLEIEAEVSDTNWYEKKSWALSNGIWGPK